MAMKKRKSMRRRGLSGSPAEHAKHADKEAESAIRAFNFVAETKSCPKKLDYYEPAVAHYGMARAHQLESMGQSSPSKYARLETASAAAFSAMKRCLLPGSLSGMRRRARR